MRQWMCTYIQYTYTRGRGIGAAIVNVFLPPPSPSPLPFFSFPLRVFHLSFPTSAPFHPVVSSTLYFSAVLFSFFSFFFFRQPLSRHVLPSRSSLIRGAQCVSLAYPPRCCSSRYLFSNFSRSSRTPLFIFLFFFCFSHFSFFTSTHVSCEDAYQTRLFAKQRHLGLATFITCELCRNPCNPFYKNYGGVQDATVAG